MYDLILKGGIVCDGSGQPSYRADVAVKGGKIARIAPDLADAGAEILEVSGRMVTPGFIDCHSHSDSDFLLGGDGWNFIEQGITTEIAGNCGASAVPSQPDAYDAERGAVPEVVIEQALAVSRTPEQFMAHLATRALPTNMAFLLGHGSLRAEVCGFCADAPTPEQLTQMKALLARALDCGFFGLSSGLIYPPSVYAKTPELIALARVLGEKGGIYASHIRGEGDFCIPAVREAIEIGETAGCPVQISHHKVEGAANEGNSRVTLSLIAEANARGVRTGYDQYPFIACSTSLISALPPVFMTDGEKEFLSRLCEQSFRAEITRMLCENDGSFDNILPIAGFDKWVIVKALHDPSLTGKSIAAVACERGCDPFDAVYDVLRENDGDVRMIYYTINESDMLNILAAPNTMAGTDGFHLRERPAPDDAPSCHPRLLATFPRHLRLTREHTSLTPEQAIRRITALPADHFGLKQRGYLREGYFADICVLDWDRVGETGDFLHPFRPNTGIEYVLINGVTALRHGRTTGAFGGVLLQKGKKL